MKCDPQHSEKESSEASVTASVPVVEDESDRTPSELLERIRVECDENAAREAAKQTYIEGPPADVAAQVRIKPYDCCSCPVHSAQIVHSSLLWNLHYIGTGKGQAQPFCNLNLSSKCDVM